MLRRRSFVKLLAAGTLAGCAARPPTREQSDRPQAGDGRIRAVAFDGFPVFDPRPVFGRAREMLGAKGGEFIEVWRGRLFEYQFLRALGRRYADFLSVNADALRFAARKVGVALSSTQEEELTAGFLDLRAWPDVKPALEALRADGLALALLSNMTPAMLTRGVEGAGLSGLFDHVLSTDSIRTYKPDPAAYQLGVDAFGLRREEIAFAAFAGWDAAGASWFGHPTIWINRLGFPAEELETASVEVGEDLAALQAFVGRSRSR